MYSEALTALDQAKPTWLFLLLLNIVVWPDFSKIECNNTTA